MVAILIVVDVVAVIVVDVVVIVVDVVFLTKSTFSCCLLLTVQFSL